MRGLSDQVVRHDQLVPRELDVQDRKQFLEHYQRVARTRGSRRKNRHENEPQQRRYPIGKKQTALADRCLAASFRLMKFATDVGWDNDLC